MSNIKKVVKKVVKVVGKEKTKEKLPSRENARFPVLLQGIKDKSIPLNKEINLSSLRIKGKLFSDIISSRPFIGTTTRKGLKQNGIACVCVKTHPVNKKLYAVVKFVKA